MMSITNTKKILYLFLHLLLLKKNSFQNLKNLIFIDYIRIFSINKHVYKISFNKKILCNSYIVNILSGFIF